ncbi:MAG: GNAT family N-acetyltransferase [Oscillospiraceae bacterium]|nr:GNAT family N-acetyltransferase [Oscillospiraceae bacterium]MBR2421333.1 GNAT family N-acetyltransferase [Oscillospiraceae bacterium]
MKLKKLPELKTERLVLRSFVDTDAENVLSILYNEQVKKTYMIPDFSAPEEAHKLFLRFKELSEDLDRFVYAICRDGQVVGFLNEVGKTETSMEVGYVIHPEHQKQGYATEALRACIGELFRIGYSAVEAGFFVENTASRRVMEKSGMHPSGKTDSVSYRGEVHACEYFIVENLFS